MRTEGGISWLPSRFETEKRRGRSGCGKTRPIKEQSTTGAEAHTDSTCLTRPWKGRSSTEVHAFVVFPQPLKPCPTRFRGEHSGVPSLCHSFSVAPPGLADFPLTTHGLRPWAAFFLRFAAGTMSCLPLFQTRWSYDTDSYGTRLMLGIQLTRQWNWRAILGARLRRLDIRRPLGAPALCRVRSFSGRRYLPIAVKVRASISSSTSSSVPAISVMETA